MPGRALDNEVGLDGLAVEHQAQLRRLDRLRRWTRNDFAANFGVASEHAVVAQKMKIWWRDQGHETSDEVERSPRQRAATPC